MPQKLLGCFDANLLLPKHRGQTVAALEQFYLPTYIKTDIASIVPSRSRFQMLLVSDGKGRAWYAREEDVEAGSTQQLNAKPIPLVMSDSARHRGMILLYRGPPHRFNPIAFSGICGNRFTTARACARACKTSS